MLLHIDLMFVLAQSRPGEMVTVSKKVVAPDTAHRESTRSNPAPLAAYALYARDVLPADGCGPSMTNSFSGVILVERGATIPATREGLLAVAQSGEYRS